MTLQIITKYKQNWTEVSSLSSRTPHVIDQDFTEIKHEG